MNFIRLSHDRVTLDVDRDDCNTTSLHQAMRSIDYINRLMYVLSIDDALRMNNKRIFCNTFFS